MTRKEIAQAEKMLAKVGRVITGKFYDERGSRSTLAICTDGDGQKQNFGTPRIFSSLYEVGQYVDPD